MKELFTMMYSCILLVFKYFVILRNITCRIILIVHNYYELSVS